MTEYRRPDLPRQDFRDADGLQICYGHRWGGDGPPAGSYSVISHAERFRPLHEVADAVVNHLIENYQVHVKDDPSVVADLRMHIEPPTRGVRLTPADPDAAALTVIWTNVPGVVVHAGLVHDFPIPVCGCDACDDDLPELADHLETLAFGVAAGGYREWYTDKEFGYFARGPSGGSSGVALDVADLEPGLRRAFRRRLDRLPEGWRPWPRW